MCQLLSNGWTCFGAGKMKRVSMIGKLSYATIWGMGIIFSLVGIVFPNGVCSIFMDMNAEMKVIANYGVRIYFIAFLPLGINLLTSYYLQAIMQAKKFLCISLLRNILLSGTGIILTPHIFSGNVLWMVIPAVESIVLIISIVMMQNHRF